MMQGNKAMGRKKVGIDGTRAFGKNAAVGLGIV